MKSLADAINRYEKQEEERKKTFLFTNLLARKITRVERA